MAIKLTRTQFIESHGATCANPNWSWSFVNHKDKFVIFGAWQHFMEAGAALILNKEWRVRRGREQPGYKQSREHIRLIEKSGYRLMTFPIIIGENHKEGAVAKIKDFIPQLTVKTLKRVGGKWFALDESGSALLPEEVPQPQSYFEGASRTVSVNSYERNAAARARCIAHYGYKCIVCRFDFAERYGNLGDRYIHVHHRIPLGEIKKEYKLDPIKDLVPICPNCHAMIHVTQPALTVEELQRHLSDKGNNPD
jgi:5-methylcytosine-specific restriction protein A